jgi:hypothetical protein
MCCPLAALLLAITPAFADPAAPLLAPPAATLSQVLGSLTPTPKQTIALRDFFSGRNDKVLPLGAQPNGLSYFEMRDAKNQRTGQIAVGRDDSDGSIFVARVSGPAVFDPSRRAVLPRVQNTKMRGAVSALLAGAEAGVPYEAVTAKNRDLFLRDRPAMALTPQPVTYPDRILEAEGSFYADGSAIVRSLRAPVGVANPAMAAIHVAAKFYPALDSDGQKAFREAVLGVDADFTATLSDLGNKVPCPVAGCTATQPAAPIALKGDVHLTRWPHAVAPSATPALIAQISPPPTLPDILQDGTQQAPSAAIDATGDGPHTN